MRKMMIVLAVCLALTIPSTALAGEVEAGIGVVQIEGEAGPCLLVSPVIFTTGENDGAKMDLLLTVFNESVTGRGVRAELVVRDSLGPIFTQVGFDVLTWYPSIGIGVKAGNGAISVNRFRDPLRGDCMYLTLSVAK